MKKLIVFIALIFALGLCQANVPDGFYGLPTYQLQDKSVFNNIKPVRVIYSNESQLRMVCELITYEDKTVYNWKSPYMTETLERGNCIDIAIYYCFIANTQLGKDYEIAIFFKKDDTTKCHAVVDLKNGKYYDPLSTRYLNLNEWKYSKNVTLKESLNVVYHKYGFR